MEIPGLGAVVEDPDLPWYRSAAPVPVPMLGGALCHIVVDGYSDDQAPEEFHAAIGAFLALDASALAAAAPAVFECYQQMRKSALEAGEDDWEVEIDSHDQVFEHVRLGREVMIYRDGDQHVQVSLECECEWAPDQGVQLTFCDGRAVTEVERFDNLG